VQGRAGSAGRWGEASIVTEHPADSPRTTVDFQPHQIPAYPPDFGPAKECRQALQL